MTFEDKQIRDLAIRIYELDEEVYEATGSGLGRVFNGDRDRAVNEIMQLLHSRAQGFKIRSELALISNMARSIPKKTKRKEVMRKYDAILHETMNLPTSFGDGDILDPKIADLNSLKLKDRFKENDHRIICIGRTFGCGGNEIGFTLADELKMNFYDVSVFSEVLKRTEAEHYSDEDENFKETPKQRVKDFFKFHGLSREDMQFFDSSKLLVQKAKEEDFIVMGRFADAVLTNNRIPHISIFITAPMKRRVQRIMAIQPNLTAKQAKVLIEKEDVKHLRRYKYYTGRKWSKASNYDLCINSASYGIEGTVEMIKRMLNE